MKRLLAFVCGFVSLTLLAVWLSPPSVWSGTGDRLFMVSQAKHTEYSSNRAAIPGIKQALSNYTSLGPGTENSIYRRVQEVRNAKGIIVQYVNANGSIILGTPRPLSINSVYPTNGATGYFNNYSVRVCNTAIMSNCSTLTGTRITSKKMIPAPYVVYNKGPGNISSTTGQFIVGKTLRFDTTGINGGKYPFLPYSVAAATTYTVRVNRQSIVQTDGEWTSSCGTATTDMGGYCDFTFSTR